MYRDWTGTWSAALCGGLLAAVAAGCGSEKFETASVKGQVTCEGKPVPGGIIYFAPVAEGDVARPGPAAVGIVDENGNYTLSTYQGGDGAIIGRNHVTFELSTDVEGLEEDVAALEGDDDPEDLAEAKAKLEAARKLAANPINCKEPVEAEVTIAPGENVIDIELATRRVGPRGRFLDEDD